MKEKTIRGKVIGTRGVETWNTRQLRWFTFTIAAEVNDLADNGASQLYNMDVVIDDPMFLPKIGDLVKVKVQIVELDVEAPEPPPEEEEIPQYGDEVALADPEDDEVEGDPFHDEIKQGGA